MLSIKIKQEHILALKISLITLLIIISIPYLIRYLNHSPILHDIFFLDRRKYIKYSIFFTFTFLIYILSYIFAKDIIKPIRQNNRKLKEYNHNIAHEIKTPLAIIKSNLELLELGFDKALIKSSNEEIIFMNNIINSLLFLNDLDYKDNIKFSKINILSLLKKDINYRLTLDVNKSKTNLTGQNKDNFLKIKLHNKTNLKKLFINGNKELIMSLISNIINNAIKHGKENSKINIKIYKNKLIINNKILKKESYNKESKESKNNINKLFDVFYQGDTSRHSEGHGLGLSIVKKICDIHGFKINLYSENNNFTVKISY